VARVRIIPEAGEGGYVTSLAIAFSYPDTFKGFDAFLNVSRVLRH
jgi:hypothetical protein